MRTTLKLVVSLALLGFLSPNRSFAAGEPIGLQAWYCEGEGIMLFFN